jgi:hypothetical protein
MSTRAGAVSFVQRFDSGLRLNVHFHVLWLDGVYGWEPGRGQPEFHAQREVNDGCVQQLVRRIADRVLRALRKAGKWVDADAAAEGDDGVGDELLPGLAAAAVEGRAALGERAGQRRWPDRPRWSLGAAGEGSAVRGGGWVLAARRRVGVSTGSREAGEVVPVRSEACGCGVAAGGVGGWADRVFAEEALARRDDGGGDDEGGADGAPVCTGAEASEAPGDVSRGAGRRDPLDEGGRGRQSGRVGFRLVRDLSLNRLFPTMGSSCTHPWAPSAAMGSASTT